MLKQLFANVLQNRCSYEFPDIHKKMSVLKPLLIQLEAWRPATLIKKRPQHKCFPLNVTNIFRIAFLWNTSGGCFSMVEELDLCRRIYKRVNTIFLCKQWHLAGLTWRKPFSTKKWRYIWHKWSLVTFKILPLRRVTGSTSCSKQRKAKREQEFVQQSVSFQYFCIASCNNNEIFVWFSLICLDSLGFL